MKRAAVAAAVLAWAFCPGTGDAVAADSDTVWVNVFDATALTLDRYTVVKRIWTQTFYAAFGVPTHETRADAIAALTSRAADAGANGVINLHCLNDSDGYFCYGLAIKLK